MGLGNWTEGLAVALIKGSSALIKGSSALIKSGDARAQRRVRNC